MWTPVETILTTMSVTRSWEETEERRCIILMDYADIAASNSPATYGSGRRDLPLERGSQLRYTTTAFRLRDQFIEGRHLSHRC